MTAHTTYVCDVCDKTITDKEQVSLPDSISYGWRSVCLHFHIKCYRALTMDQLDTILVRHRGNLLRGVLKK